MSNPPVSRFCVLVPVKAVARAKSRLAPLGDETRRALVEAFAVDTVTAALSSPLVDQVLVVTDDHRLAARLRDAGAHVVPDGVVDDLNGSLVQGAAEARRRWPNLALAALCADLPSLRGTDLSHALTSAAEHDRCFVADRQGVGTTMVTALPGADLILRFGPGSREAHLADGMHELTEVGVGTVRRDVDTPEDLGEALALGVGPCTTQVAISRRL